VSDNEQAMETAMDQLIVATSRLNAVLVKCGRATITLPERHLPIEPFFNDLTALVTALAIEVDGDR
jgi:hypothetical protein